MRDHYSFRIRDDTLAHAQYQSRYKRSVYDPQKRHERYEQTKEIVGRKARTSNPYGDYKSVYYDPVKRHERHLKEYQPKNSSSGGSSKGSGGSGGSGGGSGGSSKSSSGQTSNMNDQIQMLREESSKNIEAQREAANRKIEDIKSELTKKIQKEKEGSAEDISATKNETEILGITQQLKSTIANLQNQSASEIEQVTTQLNEWIDNEKDALEERIAAIYKSYGKEYSYTKQSDKKSASEARDKDVESRADSIYKKKKQ